MENQNLKNYSTILESKELPVFYDYIHVKRTFRIKPSIEHFMNDNISSYKVKKRMKYDKYKKEFVRDYRIIYTVRPHLSFIQHWILNNILNKIPVSEPSHAFVKGKSLLTNAKEHSINGDNGWLLRLDITNFFESIEFNKVKKIFIEMGYSKGASQALAELTTYNGRLRQGFPSSPTLSNIFLKDFDQKIINFIKKYEVENLKYTRYADDLFFSGILITENYQTVINSIKQQVGYLLSKKKLRIKKAKTSFQTGKRKRITGLYIENGSIHVSKTYIKEIERELFYCKKFGIATHLRHCDKLDKMDFYKYFMGKCAFVKMVEPDIGSELIRQFQELYDE